MDERKDRKIIVKLFCVLLSFMLWLYVINVENPNRTVLIKDIPIAIKSEEILDKLGLSLASNNELTTNIKVEGSATKVYSLSKDDFSLSIDLNSYALKEGENNIPITIDNYPEGVTIKNKDILSIKIYMEKLVKKTFKLENKVDISYANNFSAASTVVEPSEIEVYGPKSAVNRVYSVAIVGSIRDISKDYSEYFQVSAFDKSGNTVSGVQFNKDKAKLILSTNKHKEVNIKPNYIGKINDKYSIESLVLSKEKINIFGNNDLINKIDEIETEPINLSDITENTEFKCNLLLPEGVETDSNTVVVTITIKDNTVEQEEEKTITTKINYINRSEEFIYELPENVAIKVKGNKESLDKITSDNISVEASLKDITQVGDNISVEWNATLQNTTNVTLVTTTGTVNISVKTKA